MVDRTAYEQLKKSFFILFSARLFIVVFGFETSVVRRTCVRETLKTTKTNAHRTPFFFCVCLQRLSSIFVRVAKQPADYF